MISLSLILICCIVLILLLDWKVLRTLPSANRWIACSLYVLSLGIFMYNLKFDNNITPTEWIGHIIRKWAPFE
ncbi:hypothetical protein [Paenibacillus macquariensis]|uniref:Uncharacterized protein n=1 Tax=Paenibacillus macquariensis TaxID=948756 RepID=A0ABY1K9Q9_9BACL|nr:hypothetical protein [Paenibacillus macquariensis]MEC0092434.1 hypothetical protein [Paenibacillus macquariensis]OAB35397.1 hypothetical protein PMSM_09060 [Paenibacillus macquariensis subsp. macquariensis]SIR47429.1 hypothetical protein SAMN05421578_11536 [Paenibacillus macquariensis]